MSKTNEAIIRNIFKKHNLIFSEETQETQAIKLILGALQNLEKRPMPEPSNTTKIKQLKDIQNTAKELSHKLKKYHQHLSGDPKDSYLTMIDSLIKDCDTSLNYYAKKKSRSGRPLKSLPLKTFVQILILIYEEQTGDIYAGEERTTWGRERRIYNNETIKFVKSIFKHFVPNEDTIALMKMARRDPLPLTWARKMKKNVDEHFRCERSSDRRRATTLKKKLADKGYKIIEGAF